jgi:hypothetical protein
VEHEKTEERKENSHKGGKRKPSRAYKIAEKVTEEEKRK